MERGTCCGRDVVPFTAMVATESIYVFLNTLFKAATLKGMNYHTYMVYIYAIAASLLLPSPFFSHRSTDLPPLNFTILGKFCLLALVGGTSQIMGYSGIIYSSPTLSSAMSNLTPAFTFLLAIVFRMERLELRSSSSQAKILGTTVSIAGAFVVILYKGPPIILIQPSISLHLPLHSSQSTESSWVIGGLFLTTEYLLVTTWLIILAQIMKEYPSELTVLFFYNLFVCIMSTIVAFITETNLSAWRLGFDVALASILCSGIFGTFLNNAVHTWILHLKGPFYVAMFKPLSIVIAVAMGVMFLGDTLYLGSVVGATIISVGFYTVMWGKANEEMDEGRETSDLETSTNEQVPLFQSQKAQEIEYGRGSLTRMIPELSNS